MKTKTYAEYKKEQRGKQQSNSNCGSSTPMNSTNSPKPTMPKYVPPTAKKQQLIPPGSLGTLTKATYDRLKQHTVTSQQLQQRRMGPTTSALVRPAPLFSRPPPGAALRVMPPKKRVKLDEDDEETTIKKTNEKANNNRQTGDVKSKATCIQNPYLKGKEKLYRNSYIKGKEKLHERGHESPKKPIRAPPQANVQRLTDNAKTTNIVVDKMKNKKGIGGKGPKPSLNQPKSFLSQRSQLLQRSQTQPQTQRSPLHNRSSVQPRSLLPQKSTLQWPTISKAVFSKKQIGNNLTDSNEQAKQSTFLGVKFKRMKKANLADQIKRSKEGKLDLMTPDSILASVHIKDLLNEKTFGLLPPAYQYQLLILLPECDREVGSDSALRLSKHALNNEFFSRSCQEFKDKLMDGEFNSDIIQRAKHEVEVNNRVDPWKVRFFEPVWGHSTLSEVDGKTEKLEPPSNLPIVESSWASFLKFAENSTDDFEEALAKMQVAVRDAHQKQLEKEKEEIMKREELKKIDSSSKLEDGFSSADSPSKLLLQSKCTTFRNTGVLKSRQVLRLETAAKEKSRKALKKAQLLQRKKAFDKQLKDAKAKILEQARSSIQRDEDSIKAKLFSSSIDCPSPLPSSMEGTINHLNHISSLNSSNLLNSVECKKMDMENEKVINLCDSNALKKLIKNSDTANKPTPNNCVALNKHGPIQKKSGSRIVKGPATFLTNTDGNCPCDLKSMVMCIQCETFWHGDSLNGDQLCTLCT